MGRSQLPAFTAVLENGRYIEAFFELEVWLLGLFEQEVRNARGRTGIEESESLSN